MEQLPHVTTKTGLQSHRVTILVPGKDRHFREIWAYMYLSWAYRDHLAGLKCNGLFEAEGILQNANEPGVPFRNYQNNQRLKMTGIAGSGWTLVPDTSLWLSDPDGAFNCCPWVCGELLTTSCWSSDCTQSGVFTRSSWLIYYSYMEVSLSPPLPSSLKSITN